MIWDFPSVTGLPKVARAPFTDCPRRNKTVFDVHFIECFGQAAIPRQCNRNGRLGFLGNHGAPRETSWQM